MVTLQNTEFQSYLSSVGACRDAREWASDRTAQQAWDECERSDWLIWWASKAGADKKVLVRLACKFARTTVPYLKVGELHPLKAIEAAEGWCDGTVTIEEVRLAMNNAADAAAHAAAAAAYADADADADAAAAAHAADAAAHADAAASAAAYAAHAAAAADAADAAYAADAAARKQKHAEFCAMVREAIPSPGMVKK